MAFIGLRKPYFAKLNRTTNTYSDGFRFSHAVSMNVTPNYAEASLYGDDVQVEYEKSFTNANVSVGTTSTPLKAADTVFGHEVDYTTKKVIYKATDEPNDVGVGVIAPEKVDGISQYVALIILCAKFADSAETYVTKGDSLSFNTPTIEGSASALDDGRWKLTRIFDTELEAVNWVKDQLNITDTATYTISQVLSHVTSDLSESVADEGDSLEVTLTPVSGYDIDTVTVTMGGTDITATAWNDLTGKVTISAITGNVVIRALGAAE